MEQLSFEITAELRKLNKGLDKASAQIESFSKRNEARLKKFGQSAKSVGKDLSIGLSLPIVALGTASVKAASDFEETESKFSAVFSNIQKDAKSTAEALKDSYGLSNQASLELLGNTGDLLTGFGFTQQSALNLSEDVNKLAVDLASFTNFSGGAKGASEALTKALLGERESVKSLGISILESDVKAKVLENTQKGLTFETERQAKAMATLQIAQEQSKNAIGDYERTSDSFANQMRLLKSRLSDLGVEFGKILLPIAEKLADKTQQLIEWFSDLDQQTKKIIVVVAGLAAALGPLLVVVGAISAALPAILSGLAALTGPVGLVIAAIGALTAIIISNWDTIKGWYQDVANYFIELYNESLPFKIAIEGLIFVFKTLFEVGKFVFSSLVTIVKTQFGLLKDIVVGFGNVLKDILTFDFANLDNSISEFAGSFKNTVGTAIKNIAKDANKLWEQTGKNLNKSVKNALSKEKLEPLDLSASEESKEKLKEDVAESVQKGVQKGLQGSSQGRPNVQSVGDSGSNEPVGMASMSGELMPDIITDAEAELAIGLANMQTKLEEFNQSASNIISNGIANTFVGLGEALGNSLTTGASFIQSAGQVILSAIGNIATELGKQAIAIGTGMLAIKASFKNPFTAIAAGVALVAIGSAISNTASTVGQVGSGTSTSTGASTGGNGVNNNFTQSFSSSGTDEIILRARGRDLVAVLNAQDNFNNALG